MSLPQVNRNKTGGWMLLGGAVVFAVLFLHEVRALVQAVRAESWPVVTGTIVESRPMLGCGKGGSYYPLVRYRYVYNAQVHESRRIAFGWVDCGSEPRASMIAASHPPGEHVRVWVRPSSPSEATLMVGNISDNSWFGMALWPVFTVLSFMMGRSLLRQDRADRRNAR